MIIENVLHTVCIRNYKDVATDIPDWEIKPTTGDGPEFWHILFAKHNDAIAEIRGKKPADIPKGWLEVTEARALKSLEIMYTDLSK